MNLLRDAPLRPPHPDAQPDVRQSPRSRWWRSGISATTAVFSVVRGVLLQPLSYREPNRLVAVPRRGHRRRAAGAGDRFRAGGDQGAHGSVRIDWGDQRVGRQSDCARSMEAVTAASPSDNFLEMLGLKPFLGRMVSRQDIGPQWVTAVDIAYEARWQRRWHGDPDIVGKPIEVQQHPDDDRRRPAAALRPELGPNVPIPRRLDVWFPRGPGYDEGPTRSQTVIARLRPRRQPSGGASAGERADCRRRRGECRSLSCGRRPPVAHDDRPRGRQRRPARRSSRWRAPSRSSCSWRAPT